MVYADYMFYRDVFAGTMPEDVFSRCSARASDYIDAQTFGRASSALVRLPCPASDDPESWPPVKYALAKACCALADLVYLEENGGGVASEETPGYKVNYLAGISNTKTPVQQMQAALSRYLGDTGLLYRGF